MCLSKRDRFPAFADDPLGEPIVKFLAPNCLSELDVEAKRKTRSELELIFFYF